MIDANHDRDVQAAFDGHLTAVELRQRLTQAQNGIVALEAEKELYRSRWLSCVTPEEAARLRDEAEAAKHTAIAYAKREVHDMEAMHTVRSLLRGLPASATAVKIDEILAAALGERNVLPAQSET